MDIRIRIDIPLVLLPEGAHEGSHLNISFELDEAGEASKRERIAAMLERLSQKKAIVVNWRWLQW